MNLNPRDQTLKGIGILVVATFFFAAQDAITKHLVQSLSVFQIVAVRFFFFALFALAFAARRVGLRRSFQSANLPLQVVRGLLIMAEISLFALTIGYMGLAEMHALFACFPLVITALSVPLLGESVGWRRWLAVAIGFVGTLIIIRPGAGIFNPWALGAISAASMFAVYNILTRKVSRDDRFETSLVYFGLVGFLSSLVFAVFVWKTPTPTESLLLLAISITGIIGHLSLIKALELVPAVILQPFNYFVLVWAIILGFLIYGEVLDPITLAGAAIVVGSGVFIAFREHKRKVADG